jgi:U3 small nucleolar RNA-associated protein 11
MADLVDADDEGDIDAELDEDEVQILKKAKILSDKAGPRVKKRKHVLFAENVDEGMFCPYSWLFAYSLGNEVSRLTKRGKGKEVYPASPTSPNSPTEIDLGWIAVESKQRSKRKKTSDQAHNDVGTALSEELRQSHLDKRKRLLKELSARLDRDRQLRYTQREFEMQRQLMGKGGRKKILGVEKVEGNDDDDDENEDEIDARRGRRRKPSSHQVDEATYKPRVYKWRLERKR